MSDDVQPAEWVPSVYYASSRVDCAPASAWRALLTYEVWNPTFKNATVRRLAGERGREGERMLIRKSLADATGAPIPKFVADTIRVLRERHIVWLVYPTEGRAFRNFIDFGLVPNGNGIEFIIQYYAQETLAPELIARHRAASEQSLQTSALAFKSYCEANAR